MNNRLRDAAKQFMNHNGLVVLGDRVKCLLNNMATKGIHRQVQGVSTDGFSNLDDLLWSAMLEAALDKEIAKAIDHKRISLGNNGFHNLILLLRSSDLELLLKEDRRLLIIVADNLVDNILPIAVDVAIEETAVVQWLCRWQVGLPLGGNGLSEESSEQQRRGTADIDHGSRIETYIRLPGRSRSRGELGRMG